MSEIPDRDAWTAGLEPDVPALGPHPEEEAPADLRLLAQHLRGMYVALRQERFTEFQAVGILGTWLGNLNKGTGS